LRLAVSPGGFIPKKGLDLLLPAWAKLSALTKRLELVIAGPDEQGYLAQIPRTGTIAWFAG